MSILAKQRLYLNYRINGTKKASIFILSIKKAHKERLISMGKLRFVDVKGIIYIFVPFLCNYQRSPW